MNEWMDSTAIPRKPATQTTARPLKMVIWLIKHETDSTGLLFLFLSCPIGERQLKHFLNYSLAVSVIAASHRAAGPGHKLGNK